MSSPSFAAKSISRVKKKNKRKKKTKKKLVMRGAELWERGACASLPEFCAARNLNFFFDSRNGLY